MNSFNYCLCSLYTANGGEICVYRFSTRELANTWCVFDLNATGNKLIGEQYRDCRDQSEIDYYVLSIGQINNRSRIGMVPFFVYPFDCVAPRSERVIVRVYRKVIDYKVVGGRLYVCYAYRFVKLNTVMESEIKIEGVPYRAATSSVVEEELRGYDSFYASMENSYEEGCVDISLGKDKVNGRVYPYMTLNSYYQLSDESFTFSDELVTKF